MRLICPNCGAQYEVDDAAIPQTGRDVQCSNCGHGWFQLPPDVEAEAEAEAQLFEPPAQDQPALDRPVGDSPAPRQPETAPPPEPDEEDDADLDGDEPPADTPARRPRTLDDSVLAVLKEEAEREAQARRAEAMRSIETQPDLGLDSAAAAVAGAVAASAAAEREALARRKPVEVIPSAEEIAAEAARAAAEDQPDSPAPRGAGRRGLLPDIEEINSTLRPGTAPADSALAYATEQPEPRGGFRRGFMLALLVAILLAALYLMAPRLSAAVPALAPALHAYVSAVDAARLSLDGLLRSATGAVNTVTPPAGN